MEVAGHIYVDSFSHCEKRVIPLTLAPAQKSTLSARLLSKGNMQLVATARTCIMIVQLSKAACKLDFLYYLNVSYINGWISNVPLSFKHYYYVRQMELTQLINTIGKLILTDDRRICYVLCFAYSTF